MQHQASDGVAILVRSRRLAGLIGTTHAVPPDRETRDERQATWAFTARRHDVPP
ncbi:MAG: hypothetical protein PVI57_03420 [Gemmatimonadota bacterium]